MKNYPISGVINAIQKILVYNSENLCTPAHEQLRNREVTFINWVVVAGVTKVTCRYERKMLYKCAEH